MSLTREHFVGVFHPQIASFFTLNDVLNLRKAFSLAWMLRTFPDAIWRRFVHLRTLDSYIVLLPPPSTRIPKNWLAYVLLSRPWKFSVEVLEHTLLGYNFVFDESKRMRYYELPCIRAAHAGLPDYDLNGRRIVVSGLSSDKSQSRSFFASYSSFAVKSVIFDGLGKPRAETLALCVSTYGGQCAIILEPHVDWRQHVNRWIYEKPLAETVIVLRKRAPSQYEIDKIVARIVVS